MTVKLADSENTGWACVHCALSVFLLFRLSFFPSLFILFLFLLILIISSFFLHLTPICGGTQFVNNQPHTLFS